MKINVKVIGIGMALILTACGGGEKVASDSEISLQKQADLAKATLQQKADELARQASMSPPPPAEKKK